MFIHYLTLHCPLWTGVWALLGLIGAPVSPSPEKLAQAKEENLDMHQTLDQTLLELNNL